MFAVVRTGGKQYRVAAGDKIAVEKLAGEAGDKITLGDILLAGKDGEVADIVIVAEPALRQFIADGYVLADNATIIARSMIARVAPCRRREN